MGDGIGFELDGEPVEVADDGGSLLDALRDRLGVRSVKDGCSPQGQCGCCTVLVDGSPRVSCVTPARRVAGRRITTIDGLDDRERTAWAEAFCATGASQCGFCTPGIVMRLAALRTKGVAGGDRAAVDQALLAHLCRCTGWQTITEAYSVVATAGGAGAAVTASGGLARRDPVAAARRAALEGGVAQTVDPSVALGRGGFADDTAPAGALVAMLAADGSWVVGDDAADARRRTGQVQGRRTTVAAGWPIAPPPGEWVRTLATTWVEPGYLELDASWCEPGGEPASPLANGGAFGAKADSEVAAVARRLADECGRAVRVSMTREDAVRRGPKRPPIGAGIRDDGTGVVRVARCAGIGDAIVATAPGLVVEEVDVLGPRVSCALRAAGWAEAAVLLASLTEGDEVVAPNGAVASAEVSDDSVLVRVRCGRPLDAAVLRSYCIGATHMALGWVRSEAIAVDPDGVPLDLTIRSFGILRAADLPAIDVEIVNHDAEPVNGSDAVFAAVAAAAWRHVGYPPAWPALRTRSDPYGSTIGPVPVAIMR